jgi:hypothetical protein
MQLWLLLLLVQHCILQLLQQHWLLLALRVCSINCLRLQLLISAAGAALLTGAATAVQHCLLLLLLLLLLVQLWLLLLCSICLLLLLVQYCGLPLLLLVQNWKMVLQHCLYCVYTVSCGIWQAPVQKLVSSEFRRIASLKSILCCFTSII